MKRRKPIYPQTALAQNALTRYARDAKSRKYCKAQLTKQNQGAVVGYCDTCEKLRE